AGRELAGGEPAPGVAGAGVPRSRLPPLPLDAPAPSRRVLGREREVTDEPEARPPAKRCLPSGRVDLCPQPLQSAGAVRALNLLADSVVVPLRVLNLFVGNAAEGDYFQLHAEPRPQLLLRRLVLRPHPGHVA